MLQFRIRCILAGLMFFVLWTLNDIFIKHVRLSVQYLFSFSFIFNLVSGVAFGFFMYWFMKDKFEINKPRNNERL